MTLYGSVMFEWVWWVGVGMYAVWFARHAESSSRQPRGTRFHIQGANGGISNFLLFTFWFWMCEINMKKNYEPADTCILALPRLCRIHPLVIYLFLFGRFCIQVMCSMARYDFHLCFRWMLILGHVSCILLGFPVVKQVMRVNHVEIEKRHICCILKQVLISLLFLSMIFFLDSLSIWWRSRQGVVHEYGQNHTQEFSPNISSNMSYFTTAQSMQ